MIDETGRRCTTCFPYKKLKVKKYKKSEGKKGD